MADPSRAGSRAAVAVLLAGCLCGAPRAARAQILPSRPLTALGGRLVVGGSLSVSVAPGDDRAYFNLTGYDTDLLRMVQFTLDARLRLGDRFDVVAAGSGQTAIDRWRWQVYPSALYVSVRLSEKAALALRAGIIPPAFGAFLQGTYTGGNYLIGYPLAYQYATSLRTDAFPASADELLKRRGFGAVARYSRGDTYSEPGLPLVNPFGWNAGVGFSAGSPSSPLRVEVALTRGGIAHRLGVNGPGSWEVSGRVEAHPTPGLRLGTSLARGSYVEPGLQPVIDTAASGRSPREAAVGFDVEYSRDYWVLRGETILNSRTVPAFAAPYISAPLRAVWAGVEGRYKLFPGAYLAARLDRLWFGTIAGTARVDTWDADVTRFEVGGGYSIARNATVKLSFQDNRRDSHWYPRQHLVSAQVVLWF